MIFCSSHTTLATPHPSALGSPGFHGSPCSFSPLTPTAGSPCSEHRPSSRDSGPVPRAPPRGSRAGEREPGAGRGAAPPTGASRGAGTCRSSPLCPSEPRTAPHGPARPLPSLPAGRAPRAVRRPRFPGGRSALPQRRAGAAGQCRSRTCCAGSRRGGDSREGAGAEREEPHRRSPIAGATGRHGIPASSLGEAASPRYHTPGLLLGTGVGSAGSGSRGPAPGRHLPETVRAAHGGGRRFRAAPRGAERSPRAALLSFPGSPGKWGAACPAANPPSPSSPRRSPRWRKAPRPPPLLGPA